MPHQGRPSREKGGVLWRRGWLGSGVGRSPAPRRWSPRTHRERHRPPPSTTRIQRSARNGGSSHPKTLSCWLSCLNHGRHVGKATRRRAKLQVRCPGWDTSPVERGPRHAAAAFGIFSLSASPVASWAQRAREACGSGPVHGATWVRMARRVQGSRLVRVPAFVVRLLPSVTGGAVEGSRHLPQPSGINRSAEM